MELKLPTAMVVAGDGQKLSRPETMLPIENQLLRRPWGSVSNPTQEVCVVLAPSVRLSARPTHGLKDTSTLTMGLLFSPLSLLRISTTQANAIISELRWINLSNLKEACVCCSSFPLSPPRGPKDQEDAAMRSSIRSYNAPSSCLGSSQGRGKWRSDSTRSGRQTS
ncbi:hypothetical protein BU26DRAFT_597505 [Trematosphaeria pertusa]|uniref:Uncharacterized protein n=1 Tax=Trematosphaeria pertusa TaxID=390896 RepID=A0A6A6IAF1_9PLEO|nr:uncharacterized protein BU26DRAFT_597505 [Trematosphaeria pertusa]KAF2247545.1 hypothetical protein BU26DRAFT_597505 [Trematosphaeria pertusa]